MSKEAAPAQYLHIEGMDLAGKTSTTDRFIARSDRDWRVQRNSLSGHNPLRDVADAMLDSQEYGRETMGTVYAAALMADLDLYRPPTADTIQESTILLRSIAFEAIKGSPRMLEMFKSQIPRHPRFDASFMLTASHEVRLGRLAQRPNASNHDKLVVRDPESFFAMEAIVGQMAVEHFGARIIDTTNLSIDAVVTIIEGDVGTNSTNSPL